VCGGIRERRSKGSADTATMPPGTTRGKNSAMASRIAGNVCDVRPRKAKSPDPFRISRTDAVDEFLRHTESPMLFFSITEDYRMGTKL
jgi:hypothetical protein